MVDHPTDLQQQATSVDSTSASATPAPAGQSDEWENRFKGLQREYNTLKQSLAGKDGYITQLQNQLNETKSQLGSLSSTYETQLGELRGQHATATSEVEQLRTQVSAFETQTAELLRDQEIRKELAKPEHRDLLPWYDAGYLQVGDKTGDDLTHYLGGFRELLQGKSAADFQQTMAGATPPQISTNSATPGGMNAQELSQWLVDNPGHADYQRYEDQYLDLIARQ